MDEFLAASVAGVMKSVMLPKRLQGTWYSSSFLVQENTFREPWDRRKLYLRLAGWNVLSSPTGISHFGLRGRDGVTVGTVNTHIERLSVHINIIPGSASLFLASKSEMCRMYRLIQNFHTKHSYESHTDYIWTCKYFTSWLHIQRLRVRLPALPDFLRSNWFGTGSTQPRDDNWGATWMEKYVCGSRRLRSTAVWIRCADHETPSIRKIWH
jgi:hypothetical protein